jgi:hypothetical protein
VLSLSFNACSRSGSQGEITPSPTPSAQVQRAARAAEVPPPVRERWDYLNRIRQADTYDAIDRTRVDDQNQLGVVLAANLNPEQIEELMKKALEALAKKFPAQDMTLDAYAPSKPLRKLGTAHYNAQSMQVTYTPL